MPAIVVVVLRESVLAGKTATALIAAGYNAVAMTNSRTALGVLEVAKTVELLITSVNFPHKHPTGLALASMAKSRRPDIKVIFANGPDTEPSARDDGFFIATPTTPDFIVETAERLMERHNSN